MRLELAVFRLLISVEILSAGWISHQQMHVIRFPSKLKQAAAPIQKDLSKGPMQVEEKQNRPFAPLLPFGLRRGMPGQMFKI